MRTPPRPPSAVSAPSSSSSSDDEQNVVAHVRHPILRLEVLRADGTRTSEHRVFCRYQKRSVDAGTCCACVHCDSIVSNGCGDQASASVNCTITVDASEVAADPLGVRTEVGAILQKGTLVLDPSSTLKQALTLLQTENRRSLAVVSPDEHNHSIIGVIHETAFLPPAPPRVTPGTTDDEWLFSPGVRVRVLNDETTPVGNGRAMSASLTIHEAAPIRRALEMLAAAHLREATVVDDAGVPLGVFHDVEGLNWLNQARLHAGADADADADEG